MGEGTPSPPPSIACLGLSPHICRFTLTRSLRALVRIGVFPYGHIVNWSNPCRGGARCMGPMKLRWGSADGMAIRGRGVELHVTQCVSRERPQLQERSTA